MDNINIKVISQKDVIKAGFMNPKKVLDIAESAIQKYSEGKVLFPDKISQIFNEETQDRTNCLPATLVDQNVCGVKWVSVFPSNITRGLQNLSATILLSSTETGFPLALMEGTLCSNMRTAAVSTVAAKYLANSDVETIGFVGSGQQARFHFMFMKQQFPTLKVCYVSSRKKESEVAFVEDMEKIHKDVQFVICDSDYKKVVSNADILVSAISGQEPIIKSDWIKEGTFYAHVGGWEDEYQVALNADKIVCDNWNMVKHRTQTISRAYQEGMLKDTDIYADIDELVSKNKSGRDIQSEFIYFNAVGLSYVDVAIANELYKECEKNNLGQNIELQTDNVFNIWNGESLC